MVERRNTEHGTVTYLEKIGLLQHNLLAAHTVWVNDAEVGAASDNSSCDLSLLFLFFTSTIAALLIMNSTS